MHDFLERVDKLLTQKGVKRPWLSKQTNISLNTINGWFQNNRPPRVDYAHEVAKALDISLDYLMTGEEKFKDFGNPLIEEICEYMVSLNEDELQRLYGAMVHMRYMTLNPSSDQKRAANSS